MKRKNFIKRMTMPLPELEEYYRERRKDRFENNDSFSGVNLRKIPHPLALGLLKIMAPLTHQRVTVVADNRIPTNRPVIFASTHIGWDDPAIALREKNHISFSKNSCKYH